MLGNQLGIPREKPKQDLQFAARPADHSCQGVISKVTDFATVIIIILRIFNVNDGI